MMNEGTPKISSILTDHYKTKIIASMQHDENFRKKVQKMLEEKRNKEVEERDDCIEDKVAEIRMSGSSTGDGVTLQIITSANKLVSLYIKSGTYKFSDIVNDIHRNIFRVEQNFLQGLKMCYMGYREVADQEVYDKMDVFIRDFSLMNLLQEDSVKADESVSTPEKKPTLEEMKEFNLKARAYMAAKMKVNSKRQVKK